MISKSIISQCLLRSLRGVLIISFAVLSSCTVQHKDGSISTHYFGYTVVKTQSEDSAAAGPKVIEFRNVGFAIVQPKSIALGYTSQRILEITDTATIATKPVSEFDSFLSLSYERVPKIEASEYYNRVNVITNHTLIK